MWALLTVGQRHAIGQNSVVIAQAGMGQVLGGVGEICVAPTATSEVLMGWILVKHAVVSFRCLTDVCGFQGQMVAIIPSLDGVVRMGLKEDPDFDFMDFERVIGSLKGRFKYSKLCKRRKGYKVWCGTVTL
jgi:hypothetical protein